MSDCITVTSSWSDVPLPPADPVVAALNSAFEADPDAIHALLCNRVPCNGALADHPTVVVDKSTLTGGWNVGAIGLVNCVLGALGLPLVAIHFTEGLGPDGRHQLLGFQAYDRNKGLDVKLQRILRCQNAEEMAAEMSKSQ